ncbi:YchJ family protein [Flavobacterium gilvum]|uniref:Preprotein translocase subunit SecA n=1 Tax=Flavobacterium gilvum TaxID=1492737 RepID=A0AAC9N5S8_9FLAO|nr:YchJ family metal-binding protein [Flavobacterium gilvum]AOW10226.1 preprotein translocase subunit SecA [Flavobacterium gilvum]KFC58657.1 preprotein translocase SecA [Flavobacterium gilvum]
MSSQKCYCGSSNSFDSCCGLYISGAQQAPTALALMKSRYSAYATHQADYLLATTHRSERKYYSREEILHWGKANKWQKLEIVSATENTVEFKAYFIDENNANQVHHEFSTFKQENGSWFYVDGKFK